MITTQYLVCRLKEVLTDGKWITGTNFIKEIENINWKDGTRSISGLNSIANLVLHINYYLKGVNIVL